MPDVRIVRVTQNTDIRIVRVNQGLPGAPGADGADGADGAGGLTAVVDDTAPVLGGSLDGGGFDISNIDDATFDTLTVTDDAYDATGWDGSSVVPTKNAVRDKIEGLSAVYQPLDSDLTSWASVTRASGFDTFVATPSGANLNSLISGDDVALLGTEDQVLAGGATVTSKSLGTVSSGTVTPDPGDRPLQHYTNGGAHTLAPSANAGSVLVDITNNGSAGAITTSGFTFKDGDSFTTTNGHKFRCSISIGDAGSLLIVQALQ